MRPLFVFLASSLFVLQSFVSVSQTTAVDFNDKIIGEQTKIIELTLEMMDYFSSDLNYCDEVRLKAVKQCNLSIDVLNKMEMYKGGEQLKASALELFNFYKQMFTEEFKNMIVILKKGENITEEDLTYLTEINEELGAKESILDAKLESAQKDFALKNNFTISENELQYEIDEQ